MNKKHNLTNLEMLYIVYCKTFTHFLVDPLCVIIVFYVTKTPLELDSLFLAGFIYFCTYILIRIPMMLYYTDV